ncbi:chemotaxis protein CheX [Dactylosporangium sp. CS-047395]|uniref:chemotaxis protein CheX n=1 Tax=Dactylosporangium sp. CS-047395 TaxID=3239936 RepID=UPI003D94CC94
MEEPPPLTPEDLEGIIWQVWTAYLGTSPTVSCIDDPPGTDAEITASVGVAGAWLGMVVLRGGLGAAAAIAAEMLELSAVKPDDIQDATGELMNIVAGNVKSFLPKPSHLALPQVVVGRAEILWPGTTLHSRVMVQWDGHQVTVELLEGKAPQRTGTSAITVA